MPCIDVAVPALMAGKTAETLIAKIERLRARVQEVAGLIAHSTGMELSAKNFSVCCVPTFMPRGSIVKVELHALARPARTADRLQKLAAAVRIAVQDCYETEFGMKKRVVFFTQLYLEDLGFSETEE